jgi:hypothetical protein
MSAVLDLREPAFALRPALARSPELDALVPAAIATWRGRMINEHGSARVFEALADQLAGLGLADDAREARGFADEERRHGVLCGAVVEALGGSALATIDDPLPIPLHDDAATPLEAMLRNLLSICCLSETVAVALIGAERLEMPEGELHTLLGRILADEVGHARFGWRLLARLAPSLDHATKDRLGDYLEVAFAQLLEHELAHLPIASRPPALGATYGLCNGTDARRLFLDTVETAIIPGLLAHGLPARAAWHARASIRKSA